MKITKNYLRQLIRENLEEVAPEPPSTEEVKQKAIELFEQLLLLRTDMLNDKDYQDLEKKFPLLIGAVIKTKNIEAGVSR
jgi:hypothetical protein